MARQLIWLKNEQNLYFTQCISSRTSSTGQNRLECSFHIKVKTRAKQPKKYRVMCFYSIENDMQNFRHFCKKKKNTSDCHLAWFCTQPFNWSWKVKIPLLTAYFVPHIVHFSNPLYINFIHKTTLVYVSHEMKKLRLLFCKNSNGSKCFMRLKETDIFFYPQCW